MSIQSVLNYVETVDKTGASLWEIYGTEYFGLFLYSLIRMSRPRVVVELGIGCGATTCFIAQALKDNGAGNCWAVDSGADWALPTIRSRVQDALGYADPDETFVAFLSKLFEAQGVSGSVTYVAKHLSEIDFYVPAGKQIDLLFADAPASDAEGCIELLRYYLPKMSFFSSIFIDRASTINHSYLLLEKFVADMNQGRIPAHLISGLPKKEQQKILGLARHCKFTLVHLTDVTPNKRNKKQNSRAWIRIEPLDFMPHNGVTSYF